MSGIIAAAVAVVGTLLGAVIAHRYQERAANRAAARARQERSHQLLLDACTAFLALAEDYRRAQYDRWTSLRAAPESEAALTARAESHRLYVELRGAVLRLRLVTGRPWAAELAERAAGIQAMTREILFAADKDEMLARGETAEHACEDFAARARELLDAAG